MPDIHATAIIDPAIELDLADDVVIGPYCILHGPSQITIGAGTRLLANVQLQGPITIGQGNTIYPFASLGFAPQDYGYDASIPGAGLVVGDGNVIREGVTLQRATGDNPTRVGDHNYLMAYSHVAHDARVDNHVTLVNNAMVAGHAHIMDRAIMSGGSGIQQFTRIGRFAILSGNVGVAQDLPPFMMAVRMKSVDTLNVVGLRRAGLREHIKPLTRAFDWLYHSGLSNTGFVAKVEAELGDDALCMELADFVRHTKRGITPCRGREEWTARKLR